MSSEELAVAALGVSVLALVVSAFVALWNIVQFIREGARVRVTINPGLYDTDSLITVGKYSAEKHPHGRSIKRPSRFYIEVAVIKVENRGRTPVTLQNVCLDLGRHTLLKPGRRTMTCGYLEFDGYVTEKRIRLEPYDSHSFIIDMSHAFEVIRSHAWNNKARLRASVDVGGKGAVRSPLLRRWRLATNRTSLWTEDTFDLAREVYKLLAWRARGNSIATLMLPEISMSIAEHAESGGEVSADAIRGVIDRKLSHLGTNDSLVFAGTWAFDLAAEFKRRDGRFDGSSAKETRPARGSAAH